MQECIYACNAGGSENQMTMRIISGNRETCIPLVGGRYRVVNIILLIIIFVNRHFDCIQCVCAFYMNAGVMTYGEFAFQVGCVIGL